MKNRVILTLVLCVIFTSVAHALQVVSPANSIIGENANDLIGSGGGEVIELPNGNIVITSPNWNNDRGAVTCLTPNEYKSSGITVNAANSLVGSMPGNEVGLRITVLANGHYVVVSSTWDNGGIEDVGAVTWVNGNTCIPYGETGRAAEVSADNSLIGSSMDDWIGIFDDVTPLANGNYVVRSPNWDNGGIIDAGAITLVNGSTGMSGVIGTGNSLVGSTADDKLGYDGGDGGILSLPNGNYVVSSPNWDNGAIVDVGAVTWVNGATGLTGTVGIGNSLIGIKAGDRVGHFGAIPLSNGNYVVSSPSWDNGAIEDVGAVTWVNGATGLTGNVDSSNSLIGVTAGDQIGYFGITPLTNGHFVVKSMYWDNGAAFDVGAVTWVNGTLPTSGVVSASNSLIGATSGDRIGNTGVTSLSNGNYIVRSSSWDNGAVADVGAVTWVNGSTSTIGVVGTHNSLVGVSSGDDIGRMVMELANGHYVVVSPFWDNGGEMDAGAVTWVSSATTGVVSADNSLVGQTICDQVGSGGIYPLPNGHYVISSPKWDQSSTIQSRTGACDLIGSQEIPVLYMGRGAVTWANGTTGISGLITAENSLIGSISSDYVGSGGITILTNGNYVIDSPQWDNAAVIDAGAVTWASGVAGVTGFISAANSLVGSTQLDSVGDTTPLPDGNYVVTAPFWDHHEIEAAGAATWGNGTLGTSGLVSAKNSLIGSTEWDDVGIGGVFVLQDGSFFVSSGLWNNGTIADVGALTYSTGSFESPNVLITTGGTTTVIEGGTTDSYTIELDSQPIADVVVTLSLPALPEFSVDKLVLTFTRANWYAAQTVILTANDDIEIEGTELQTIGHSVVSTDPDYNNFPVINVEVAIRDNTELVSNSSFEDYTVRPSQPDHWTGKALTRDRLKCNSETKTFSHTGLCAYRFTGSATENAMLNQLVSDVSVLVTGMTLNTSVYYRTNAASPKLKIKVKIFYTGVLTPDIIKGTINTSSTDYTLFTLTPYIIESGTIERIKIQFQNKAPSGKLYLDDVSLNYSVP